MKALVILAPKRAEIREVETPKASGEMILIRVKRAGICATDNAIYSGECSFVKSGAIKYPVRIGHEYSGVVEAVGEGVEGFRVGDRVFSDCAVTCGRCQACREKRYGDCRSVRSLGTVNTWDGSLAEFILMPERHVFHLPDSLSFDEAALIEPLAVAYDAFRDINLKSSDIVAVAGPGPIGMAAAWLAKVLGAGTVAMVGRNDSKLEVAKQIGCDRTINARKEDSIKALRDLSDGRGVDLFIEASSSEAALKDGLLSTRRYGVVSAISFYDKNISLPVDELVLGCLNLKGAAGRFGNPQAVCEIMRKAKTKLTPIITHRTSLDNCLDFFENEVKYHNEKIKAMVEFN